LYTKDENGNILIPEKTPYRNPRRTKLATLLSQIIPTSSAAHATVDTMVKSGTPTKGVRKAEDILPQKLPAFIMTSFVLFVKKKVINMYVFAHRVKRKRETQTVLDGVHLEVIKWI